MWKSDDHSDDDNLRWAWLRAVEWRHWPLFISQPIIPLLFYFCPPVLVIGGITIVTFVWWLIVPARFTPVILVDFSVYFVWLRFGTSPVSAYFLWQNGEQWTAALVLFWLLAGNWIVLWLLIIPQAALSSTERAKAAQIGLIQERLMRRLGYSRIRGEGYIRERMGSTFE